MFKAILHHFYFRIKIILINAYEMTFDIWYMA